MSELINKGAKLVDTIRAACNYDQAVGTLTLSADERKALIAWLDALESRWYSISTLPDDNTTVLLADKGGEVFEGYHEGDEWYNTNARCVTLIVYAWRHIPAAPRQKDLR